MYRLGVGGGLILGSVDQVRETRHLCPEILKSEGWRPTWATMVGEQQRAVIRERRGEGLQNVGVESQVPAGVTERPIKPHKGRVDPLITPSVFPVEKTNLFKLASVDGMPELAHETEVQIIIVLICGLVNEVEIADD